LAAFKKLQIALADRIRSACLPVICREVRKLGIYFFVNTLDHRRGEAVYNTTFAINPEGRIFGKYDKIHATFETGNRLGRHYSVFDTAHGRFGNLICADRNYPETSRILALSGARLHIINFYGFWGEGKNDVMLKQRARENGVFIMFVHPRETVICSPEGRVIAGSSIWENTLVRNIDLAQSGGRQNLTFTIPEGLVKTFRG
jgi:predicted amidohydrolase